MNPLKLAVIGSGPSAFYVASRLFKLLPSGTAPHLRVHLYDRLWAPHGLVRYGVAPDHPEVKNCTHKFEETARDGRFKFFGNVNVSSDLKNDINPIPHALSLPLSDIAKHYTHILFATGCTLPTLHPSIPPSTHSIPALDLVHWYTSHPSASSRPPPPLHEIEHVSIVGNGNVSLDVARILLMDPDKLAKYDVPRKVLDVLRTSRVEHVSIIGRRGPLEAAFTMKELREMMSLEEAALVPLDPGLLEHKEGGVKLTRQQSRVLELLKKGSKMTYGTTKKTWSLDFLRSPVGLTLPSPSSPSSSSTLISRPKAHLSLAHTIVDPLTLRAVPTGDVSTTPTDLVISSLGFHAEPTGAFYDPSLRHLRRVLPTPGRASGNVGSGGTGSTGNVITSTGQRVPNVYASGWAATGAKGVLASTMMDAYGVADCIVGDWKLAQGKTEAESEGEGYMALAVNRDPNIDLESIPEEVKKGLKDGRVTTYDDWIAVDKEEIRRGQVSEGQALEGGKERERMGWDEARTFLASSRQSGKLT